NAIIDKGATIESGMQIGVDPKEDAKHFYVSPGGIVLVVPDMLGQRVHEAR
ncbi:MAG TPA: glucose-1-phosphate adenylyltransferase, partial [Gammaproteobacteria bacterium]